MLDILPRNSESGKWLENANVKQSVYVLVFVLLDERYKFTDANNKITSAKRSFRAGECQEELCQIAPLSYKISQVHCGNSEKMIT